MQTDKTLQLSSDDEKVINFRPSPNFLNMKRFLKKKIVDTQNVKGTQAYITAETMPKKENDFQPPLPQYPPPDSPPETTPPSSPSPKLLNLVEIKKEIEDASYETPNANSLEILNTSLKIEPMSKISPEQEKEKPRMCRDFVRGTCIRKQCKLSHVIDVTQLDKVYTFCWNYQNKECKDPNCKYVHANQFEEGEFRRTGILPARVKARMNRNNDMVPPPPRPLEVAVMQPQNRPATWVGPELPAAVIAAIKPTLKRDWSKVDQGSTLKNDQKEQSSCESCVDMEFRMQYFKGNVEKLALASAEMDDKMRAADRKLLKLYAVLAKLKPQAQPQPQHHPNNIMEQLSTLLGIDNRTSL